MIAKITNFLTNSLPLLAVTFLSAGGVIAPQVSRWNEIKDWSKTSSVEELRNDLKREEAQLQILKQFPTFGFDNLIADWVFLQYVQYFGDREARLKTDYRLSPEYFEVIIEHDPYFVDAYPFLSISTSLYAGMPERTIALMEKGLESFSPEIPKSYFVWRFKAVDELLFIGDPQAARQSFETAARWARFHSTRLSKNVERFSRRSAMALAEDSSSRSTHIAGWAMILNNAVDKETRQTAIKRIQELGGKVSINSQGKVSIEIPQHE